MGTTADILIIGAGPAGASAAALLARHGFVVILCETKTFPRSKVCGEFVSTAARPLLHRLGLLEHFDAHAGPAISRLLACPTRGPTLRAPMPADHDRRFPRAISRATLDEALLTFAKAAGAQVLQPCHVTSAIGNARDGFAVQTSAGPLHAKTLILAHGQPSRPNLSNAASPPKRHYVAFKAHFASCNLSPDTIAIAGAAGLYAGLVQSSDSLYSLAFVITRDRLDRFGNAPESQLDALRSENKNFAHLLDGATRHSPWLAAGPLAPGVRTLYDDGRFFVGNAAGEVHALVGEGITLALQSAALLADTLKAHGLSHLAAAGAEYEKKWRKQFTRRYAAAQLFANLLMRPRLSSLAAKLLGAFPPLLQTAVRLSGK